MLIFLKKFKGISLGMMVLLGGSMVYILNQESQFDHDMRHHDHHHDHSVDHHHTNHQDLKNRLLELDRLIEKEPQKLKWKSERAHINMELNPSQAVDEYRVLLLNHPEDLYILLHFSQALMRKGDLNQAYVYAQKFVERVHSAEGLELMAQIHYRKKNYQKAIDYSESCLELAPNNLNVQKIIEYSEEVLAR